MFLIAIFLILQTSYAFAQSPELTRHQLAIKGKWSWGQGIGQLDTTGHYTPGSNYANWKYVFLSDGKFIEFQKKHKHRGVYKLSATELELELDDTPMLPSHPHSSPVIWLNNDLFYTTGQEGKNGAIVFSYFKRIKRRWFWQ